MSVWDLRLRRANEAFGAGGCHTRGGALAGSSGYGDWVCESTCCSPDSYAQLEVGHLKVWQPSLLRDSVLGQHVRFVGRFSSTRGYNFTLFVTFKDEVEAVFSVLLPGSLLCFCVGLVRMHHNSSIRNISDIDFHVSFLAALGIPGGLIESKWLLCCSTLNLVSSLIHHV